MQFHDSMESACTRISVCPDMCQHYSHFLDEIRSPSLPLQWRDVILYRILHLFMTLCFMLGGLLAVKRVVAITEGAELLMFLAMKDMAFHLTKN